jgi:uncharacterized sulfatase
VRRAILLLTFGIITALAGAATKPNILLIVADDLNTQLGHLGDPTVLSPQLDALARRGVVFENAYCQAPLCNPSRTSFLSGKRPETTRVMDNATEGNRYVTDLELLPVHFQRHGYRTLAVGKVVQGGLKLNQQGWDRYESGNTKADAALNAQMNVRQNAVPVDERPYQSWAYEGDESALLDTHRTALALQHLRAAAAQTKPFLLKLGFHNPHAPWIVPKRFFDRYPLEKIPLPVEPVVPAENIPGFVSDEKRVPDATLRQYRQAYFAAISYMDELVGQVLAELTRLKLADNTVVVFLSDHGWSTGQHGGKLSKGSLWRQDSRAPLIVSLPGAAGNGQRSQRVVELLDLYPTLVELCGLTSPAGLEGRSLAPLLAAPARPWPHFAQTTHVRGRIVGRAISTEAFRYVEWGDGKNGQQLFDLAADSGEYRNLAREPAYAAKLAELRALIVKSPEPLVRNDLERRGKAKQAAK